MNSFGRFSAIVYKKQNTCNFVLFCLCFKPDRKRASFRRKKLGPQEANFFLFQQTPVKRGKNSLNRVGSLKRDYSDTREAVLCFQRLSPFEMSRLYIHCYSNLFKLMNYHKIWCSGGEYGKVQYNSPIRTTQKLTHSSVKNLFAHLNFVFLHFYTHCPYYKTLSQVLSRSSRKQRLVPQVVLIWEFYCIYVKKASCSVSQCLPFTVYNFVCFSEKNYVNESKFVQILYIIKQMLQSLM